MTNEVKLGQLPDENAVRDAVHVAVMPVVAGCLLRPGEHVGVRVDGTAVRCGVKMLGVVDPYLHEDVEPGERFYLCLYPNTVTSLRHVWTHPAFGDEPTTGSAVKQPPPDKEASRKWLEEFAADMEVTYDELLTISEKYVNTGLTKNLHWDTPDRVFQDADAFWRHYMIVTGRNGPTDADRDRAPFSCSC